MVRIPTESGLEDWAGRFVGAGQKGYRVILFAIYAALVWYGCWRYRRRWQGVVWFATAIFGMYFLWRLYTALVRFSKGAWDTSSMLLLFGAEAFIVIMVGGTLLAVRRDKVERPCRRCRYELKGLEELNPQCPECGLAWAHRKPRRGRCIGCGRRIAGRSSTARCGACEEIETAVIGAGTLEQTAGSESPSSAGRSAESSVLSATSA